MQYINSSLENLINDISSSTISDFFKQKSSAFKPITEEFELDNNNQNSFESLSKIGEIPFKDSDELLVFCCKAKQTLTERSSKKKQFEIARRTLVNDDKDGAIFIFYDEAGNFRFSFIRKNYGNKEQKLTSWKRYTYYVEKDKTNKTFKDRISNTDFSSLDTLQKAFSVEKLTEDFYKELFAWYQWTLSEEIGITFPNNTETSDDDRIKLEEQIIRLITRLLFVWFIKQKKLVPNNLFDYEKLKTYLTDFDPNSKTVGNYYNAILQNLFFATLNKEIDGRAFSKLEKERDIKTLYRYAEMFSISENQVLALFNEVPFLNGGLFECLDKTVKMNGINQVLDGFSKNATRSANGNFKHRAFIPNCVFFDESKGIIPLLERYNFTVEENAPNEVQVALEPELLGNVFENLLGAFNPETKETARKQSGSFYTPREIVSYMVDESLISYLLDAFPNLKDEVIRGLFTEEEIPTHFFQNSSLCEEISSKLKEIKILDPACGSGAFPMGILNRMVEVLEKLACHKEKSVYDLKLHLIEECIYGVDIQTIAVQISKLRFFISLIVEEGEIDLTRRADNYGILTLPNLETKFVSANTLIGLATDNKNLLSLNDSVLEAMKTKLWEVRKDHFYAKSAKDKKALRVADEKLRDEIKNYVSGNAGKRNAVLITQIEIQIVQLQNKRKNFEGELWVDDTTKHSQVGLFDSNLKNPSIFKVDKNLQERNKIDADIKILQAQIVKEQNKAVNVVAEKEIETIAKWNPYDQNSSSPFFDLEWMFGLDNGFDLVIGNPPYVQLQKNEGKLSKMLENLGYKTFVKTGDIYSIFYERGWQLLRNKGFLCFITSNKWMRAGYGESTREFFANNTNPILLVDFAGQKIFESATVDTNILLFSKEKNKQQTRACVIREKVLNNLSVYFRQNSTLCDFSSSDSWVILSGIEQKIKAKIEAVGVPLKNWDINIYRGILTGYNEAFIINGKKKDELIAEDPKSAEIIRPLLRGRDIKRYSHEFDNLYLITTFPSLKINIELYPAVRQHLISFGYDRLKQTGDKGARKKTNNQWFETQDSISYWEDFSKQKIVWKRIGSILRFSYDDTGIMALDSTCFATGKHIKYLVAVLNSKMGRYLMKDAPQTGTGDLLISVQAIEPLKIPIPNSIDENLINQIVDTLLNNSDDISSDLVLEIDRIVYNLYNLDTDECSFIESQRTQ
ncbi:Eco57I restriction-modification methylase domain-containing protein [Pedobacter sp. AJM]|uniref:Eco57I restriction-modification methylase domain-containing protein n=1 Tax=Pedobacter sp. AJM TaxID=2003629 RepID=UPI001C0EC5CE|nr:Eco57I restriction-modification methylase domain-containing protein [Pedobacter sp. AJM]